MKKQRLHTKKIAMTALTAALMLTSGLEARKCMNSSNLPDGSYKKAFPGYHACCSFLPQKLLCHNFEKNLSVSMPHDEVIKCVPSSQFPYRGIAYENKKLFCRNYDLYKKNVAGANFAGANLSDVNFTGTVLTGAYFDATNLDKVYGDGVYQILLYNYEDSDRYLRITGGGFFRIPAQGRGSQRVIWTSGNRVAGGFITSNEHVARSGKPDATCMKIEINSPDSTYVIANGSFYRE